MTREDWATLIALIVFIGGLYLYVSGWSLFNLNLGAM